VTVEEKLTTWLMAGFRKGETLVFKGERLRELGLEPGPKQQRITSRITKVTHDSITVSTE
jgi:hypothetical protein